MQSQLSLFQLLQSVQQRLGKISQFSSTFSVVVLYVPRLKIKKCFPLKLFQFVLVVSNMVSNIDILQGIVLKLEIGLDTRISGPSVDLVISPFLQLFGRLGR